MPKAYRCRNIYNTSVITHSQKITYAYQRAYWSFSGFAGARPVCKEFRRLSSSAVEALERRAS
jgi:hypothetical protein